jgi:hypothetical protein
LVAGSLYSELVVVNGPGAVASGAVWPNETAVAASMAVIRTIVNFVFSIGYSREAGCFHRGMLVFSMWVISGYGAEIITGAILKSTF